ncbi:MAG: histidine triad nucleotide-binding protein [Ruminococcaceae bacterium]|nr:histidine triad nucleotide-binding protein [Oscillospiraceae bacterium]
MCLFCEIAKKNIPSTCVYEDETVFVFNDIAPKADVHMLVIPKEHIGSMAEVTAENSAVVAHCFEVIAKLMKEKGIADDGFRVISNCGEKAGQTVFHLHFHVLAGNGMTEAHV